jgi:hypothetical protein
MKMVTFPLFNKKISLTHLFVIITVLSLLSSSIICCKTITTQNIPSSLSETELLSIRDSFDTRVFQAFTAQKGKPLKRARINPPLHPERPAYSRGYSFSLVTYATRCMWLNEQIDSANMALQEDANYYLEDPGRIYDRDNFHWHAQMLLRLIELFGIDGSNQPGLLQQETENKILEAAWLYSKRVVNINSKNRDHLSVADHKISNTWFIVESENHHVQSFTTLWHFAKLAKNRANFQNRIYDDGLKAADHYEQWNEYAKIYLTERAKKGMFVEMMCTGYNTTLLKGIFNFYDFAEDEELKRKTGLFLDLYFTYWGQEQLDGISGGGKSRIYSDILPETSGLGYFFFGVGNNPGINGSLLTAMTSSYRPPLVVVDIVCDRLGRGDYEVIQRPLGLAELNGPPLYKMLTDSGGIVRYTYCTPSFIIGTAMVNSSPYSDWAAISAQNRSHGVIFEGHPAACIIPQNEKTEGKQAFNAQWSVQRKGTLICQKLKTSKDTEKTRIWFSGNGLSAPVEEKNWIFVESKSAYAALFVVEDSTYWEEAGNRIKGKWLYCKNEYSPIILEVVQKEDYKSFQEFKDQITGQTIDFNNKVLKYKGIYGDLFTLYTDYSHVPQINNVNVDYAPAKAFDSPFLEADWDSGIVHIQKGQRKLELNFLK